MLEHSDEYLIELALNIWANWIETGDVTISAADAINIGEHKKVKALALDQAKLIIRLRELAIKQRG